MVSSALVLLASLASVAIAVPVAQAPQRGPGGGFPGGPGGPGGRPGCSSRTTAAATTGAPTPTISTPSNVETSSSSAVDPPASTTSAAVAVTITLPLTGGATELPAPDASWVVKKIGLGHGLQNYTCADANNGTTAGTAGALAVLYDVTDLYPGTPGTGLASMDAFNALVTTTLYTQDLPINLVDPTANSPGSQGSPNAKPESSYLTTSPPFPAPNDLVLGSVTAPFLGHHFFDNANVPTFDLSAAGLLGKVTKKETAGAPTADKGILGTGTVAWVRLPDNGASQGITAVYRVITDGGSAQACSVSGSGPGNVPYAAYYFFFGLA